MLISRNLARHRYTYNNRKWYMACQMAATAVTLNDLKGHSPVAGLFKCNPSNICAAFYTMSADSVLARFLCISRAPCRHRCTAQHLPIWSNTLLCCGRHRRCSQYDRQLSVSASSFRACSLVSILVSFRAV